MESIFVMLEESDIVLMEEEVGIEDQESFA